MFNHKSTKKVIILLLALTVVAATCLSACNPNAFTPLTMPDKGEVSSNGGNAVKYGDWIYYVNGYESSASATNTYENVVARVGAIARVRVSDLESMFAVFDDKNFTTSNSRTEEIARLVAEKAQIVVPNVYYSGNTTTTNLNGIYIFDDKLYLLTPNDELTAGGSSLTNQSVLTSYNLDGSKPTRHYVFTDNTAQIMLAKVDGKLVATYLTSTTAGCVDVNEGKLITSVDAISGAKIDVAGNAVFYVKDKAVCMLKAGASEAKTVVQNDKDSTITYTIASANDGYVYYTKADSTNASVDNTCLYYATETESGKVALAMSAPSSNYYGYKTTIVRATSEDVQGTTLYGIYVLNDSDGTSERQIVSPEFSSSSITFNRLEGDKLYYTTDSVAYVVDLSAANPQPVAYGRSLAAASGWSVPDVLDNYVITLGTGSVTVVKFDADKKENGNQVTLTKVEPKKEDDKK